MKSALFVDFDNVYSGLRRLDLAYAETFASDPLRWMNWIARQLPVPLAPEAPVARRILVRRCYLNPVMYQRFRFGFSKAGFEIVDCPPMTTAGKTSTDIHMVLDIVDVLQSPTHYDEFIVFSADADFTPVLRKLRRDDRRTTIFAAGATSASYDASSDLIIDPEAFIQEALGFGDEDHAPAAVATAREFEALLAQAEALTRAAVDRATEPVPLTALTKLLATQVPGLTESGWAGRGHFTALLRDLRVEPLRIDRERNWIMDPRRVNAAAEVPPPAPEQGAGELRAQIAALVAAEVAASPTPVPLSRLAQRVRQQCAGTEPDWLGCGSFKKLLDTVPLGGLQISWSHPSGHLMDPARHVPLPVSPDSEGLQPAPRPDADPRWPQVLPLLQAARLPVMSGPQYAAVLQGLSQTLSEGPFALAAATKRVRDLCQEQQVPVARADINALVRVLLFNGFDPATADCAFAALVATTCGVVVAACEREGLRVSPADREMLLDWVLDGVHGTR